MSLFHHDSILPEDRNRFEELRKSGVVLKRPTHLMSKLKTGGFRATMRAIKKIIVLNPGTELELLDIALRSKTVPWYKVRVKSAPLISGWINSLIFLKENMR